MKRFLLPLVLLSITAAGTAVAADPESGSVSAGSPSIKWTGTVTDPGGAYDLATLFTSESTDGTCQAPACDTFALKVEGGGQDLTIDVNGPDADNLGVDIIKPDGSNVYTNPAETANRRTVILKKAPAGDYVINTFGTGSFDYTATATFANIAPKATPTPEPGATATPGPSPTATPAPSGGGSAPGAAPKLTVSAGKVSVKKVVKAKKLPVTVTSSAAVTRVQVLVVRGAKPGGKVVLSGTLAKLNGKASIKLKLKSKPKPGKHTLVLSALDAQGRRVGASKPLTIRK